MAVKKLIWHEVKLSAILLFASRSHLLQYFLQCMSISGSLLHRIREQCGEGV